MAQEELIMAIGRIERALSRLEQAPIPRSSSGETDEQLRKKHELLKRETSKAIHDIDALLKQGAK